MTQGVLYMVDSTGALTAMSPSAPASEDEMQRLVATYPDLITDGDGDLLLIRREQPIGDGDASGRWSIDHLFVTRDAVPVLVELKRAVDTRLRREVVGQMLDYAANATVHWQAGRIADAFAASSLAVGVDPEERLAEFIGDSEPETFWAQVDSNFKAGRIKLVFVADTIPSELARIVEFMNEQMRADVRAVELRWFAGNGITTLSPRIIGETARAAAGKADATGPKLDRAAWITTHLGKSESAVAAAHVLIAIIEEEGGVIDVALTQGSLYCEFVDPAGREYYPFHLWRHWREGSVSLNLSYLKARAAFKPEAVRQRLLDQAVELFGAMSTRNVGGFPSAPLERLSDPAVADGFRALVRAVVAVATDPRPSDTG